MSGVDFIQSSPSLENTYDSDIWLQELLRWKMTEALDDKKTQELKSLGADAAGKMWQLSREAELKPPAHRPFDAWGNRVDEIQLANAWIELGRLAAQYGIVASGYENQAQGYHRLYQAAKLYLYHPSSAFFSCPLAMTDGAAKVISTYADTDLKSRALLHLTSRDPKQFWTSGQWMTEKSGGSDVSETATTARRVADGYELNGIKWFTSSVSSEMSLALARIDGAQKGSKGLSLFYLEMKTAKGDWNGVEILRLKDKLGTRALPTAELRLNGCRAQLIGSENQGVKTVATMLNITRLYNSVCAVAQMRRGLSLLHDYSKKRIVFANKLLDQPIHQFHYAQMMAEFVGNLVLTFSLADCLGKEESAASAEHKVMSRLLTPLTKLYTGRSSVQMMTEVVEAFGGAGYIEDTGIPVLLRDAQVFPIWEGPTNVLSLDVLRVLHKENGFAVFEQTIKKDLEAISGSEKKQEVESLHHELNRIAQALPRFLDGSEQSQALARHMAMVLCEVYIRSQLLCWQSNLSGTKRAAIGQVLRHWSSKPRQSLESHFDIDSVKNLTLL